MLVVALPVLADGDDGSSVGGVGNGGGVFRC